MDQLTEMLVEQLRDAFSAEKQAIQGMKRNMRKVTDPTLREGIQAHIEQSETQRERVEQALSSLEARPGRKVCEAMRGLVEEAQHEQEEQEKGPLLDLVTIAALQRIEHYEIAAYGTMTELARALEKTEVADLMAQTLEEEKAQDQRLTEVTRSSVLPAAMQAGEEEEDSDEESGRKRAARKGSAKRSG
jgi:ferritin-like metal-binding protein YciE